MEVFIKSYVLISLWFWAGMLMSAPLRRAFEDMHWRMLKRIYNATLGQVVKLFKKIVDAISKRYKKATLYVEDRTYDLRVKVARTLVDKELLEELNHKNLLSAIGRARQISHLGRGLFYEELLSMVRLAEGEHMDKEEKLTGLKTAFEVSETELFKSVMDKIPRAQERILLAFDQAVGDAPYDSIKNQDYRKFIRD